MDDEAAEGRRARMHEPSSGLKGASETLRKAPAMKQTLTLRHLGPGTATAQPDKPEPRAER